VDILEELVSNEMRGFEFRGRPAREVLRENINNAIGDDESIGSRCTSSFAP
jgi:hypothetical protein